MQGRRTLVEVPDEYAGLLLVERLGRLAPGARVEGRYGDLWLAFDLEPPQLPRALQAVQLWLQEIHVRAARIRIGNRECSLEA